MAKGDLKITDNNLFYQKMDTISNEGIFGKKVNINCLINLITFPKRTLQYSEYIPQFFLQISLEISNYWQMKSYVYPYNTNKLHTLKVSADNTNQDLILPLLIEILLSQQRGYKRNK